MAEDAGQGACERGHVSVFHLDAAAPGGRHAHADVGALCVIRLSGGLLIENEEAADQAGVVVMPGALDLVRSVPAGKWGVVTSGSRLLATNRLPYCGLPVPDVLVTSDDVTHGKPYPEPYLKGAERLGFSPAECLVIEDAPAGIAAARAAGMRVIGMASTYAPEKLHEADAVVKKLAGIRVMANGAGRLGIEVRVKSLHLEWSITQSGQRLFR